LDDDAHAPYPTEVVQRKLTDVRSLLFRLDLYGPVEWRMSRTGIEKAPRDGARRDEQSAGRDGDRRVS
jgi:hypothetical protein